MDIKAQLGMRIKYLRKQNKLSQEKLSLISGVNKNYLSDLERGRRNPTITVLEKIASAFDMDIAELLKGLRSFDGV